METRDRMRAAARTFEDLVVWQKAHQFALAVYRLTRTFPRSEVYGLTSQFRRAAVSIAANVAEPLFPAYNASKAGVAMLTKAVAVDCARKGWPVRPRPTSSPTPRLP